jgi:hypothetical protein
MNDYSRGNAYFRSGGDSSSGGELAPQSFRSNPRIAQRVVKRPPRVRFPGLKEFGRSESDSGPPKNNSETLNKTIGCVAMQCHKCISRYHIFLKFPEEGRSVKVTYISMMMDTAEDFSERDPGELLAECISDLQSCTTIWITMSLQISKIMLMISHVSTSSISLMMTPAICTMAYALKRNADSQCAAFVSTIHSFDQPIPSIRY